MVRRVGRADDQVGLDLEHQVARQRGNTHGETCVPTGISECLDEHVRGGIDDRSVLGEVRCGVDDAQYLRDPDDRFERTEGVTDRCEKVESCRASSVPSFCDRDTLTAPPDADGAVGVRSEVTTHPELLAVVHRWQVLPECGQRVGKAKPRLGEAHFGGKGRCHRPNPTTEV